MSSHSLFENFINDKLFTDYQFGVVRLHHDNEEIRKKFKTNDLVVIVHHGRKTRGILRFEIGVAGFNKNSIYLTWNQRRDLALSNNEKNILALEIRKGNFSDSLLYFFDSLFQ
jgi:hypothetical protein